MTVHLTDLSEDLSLSSVAKGMVSVPRRPGVYRNVVKRIFDITAILLSSVVVAPVILVLAIIVARDGHAPFFSSERVGRCGRVFRMIKLRTMVHDAEVQLERYLAENAEAHIEWETTQKLKNDPRITAIGRFLRKISLDELPQVWNVLVGDMSIVGPRPMMPAQRGLYRGLSYYALRPGITGPWQVSVRNESEFAQRAEFDTAYDQGLSLSGDLRLILQTALVVLRGTGY